MSDTAKVFGTTYTGVTSLKVSDGSSNTLTYIRPQGTKSITENGTGIDVAAYATVDVAVSGGGSATLITKSITENGTYDAEDDSADGYSSVTVTVPTGTARTSSDLTVSGDTVTVPAGLYSSQATASVAAGSAGTPTATKGTVSNHSVSVTPSVTNTTGYITGSTKTGTAVTVSASELVSGTKSISSNGTGIDVTNYADVDVSVPTGTARTSTDVTVSGDTVTIPAGLYSSQVTKSVDAGSAGTPTATKGTVSNHQISVTPSVTNTTGYITGGTKTGTAVTVTASELASGNKSISSNGTDIDVVGYSTVSVSVSPSLQAKTNISPTTSSQTIEPDSGYDGLSSVQINAMPSMTLPTAASASGSGTTKATISRSTSDQYINIPTGYNSAAANYKVSAVANGTAGTPTATKGTVSNHQVSVTPSVTNTTGYITGSTINGTAVTVTASELASGNKAIVDNGTNIDVVGYSTVSVAVPFSSITVSSSNPSGGNNGDIWIKTS